jgi:erythromycin esterase-like protein
MEKEVIKVRDIVEYLTEKNVEDISKSLARLSGIAAEYYNQEDIYDVELLEKLKRRLVGELLYLNTLYNITKSQKDESHTYMTAARKRIKSEAINLLLSEGKKVTMAETLVYSHPYYTARMEVLEALKRFCIKVENLRDTYESVLNSVIQSVSISSKEKQSSIHQ